LVLSLCSVFNIEQVAQFPWNQLKFNNFTFMLQPSWRNSCAVLTVWSSCDYMHSDYCVLCVSRRSSKFFLGLRTILQNLGIIDVMLDLWTKKEYLMIKTWIAYVKKRSLICNLSQFGYVQSWLHILWQCCYRGYSDRNNVKKCCNTHVLFL